jgi:GDP-L-fucose synthase
MNPDTRIYVAGHRGLVGSAITRELESAGYRNLITRTHAELDLTNQQAVNEFFDQARPQYVFLAAAKVGGIQANNSYPADFIYENLMIQTNIVHAAYRAGVERLLFLGSSCIYPRLAEQPMTEDVLMTGALEPTNEPYAIAKIAGIKLCESYNRQYDMDFRSVMPTNLYGPNDNFDLETSHVMPALIRKFHEAKTKASPEVTIWGTGNPRREFLYVDDLAAACVHIMQLRYGDYAGSTSPMQSHINVGTGEDVTIRELAELIRKVVGYEGPLTFDTGKPDGTPRKCLDVSKIKFLGWQPRISLEEGVARTYEWFLQHFKSARLD